MRKRRITGAAMALVLALSGCSGLGSDDGDNDGDGSGGPGATAGAGATARHVEPSATIGSGGATAGSGGATTPDKMKVIVERVVNTPASAGGTLKIGVVELRVAGKLLYLSLALTPNITGDDDISTYKLNGRKDPSPTLLDTVNLRRHSVVRAGRDRLQPNYITDNLPVGQTTVQTFTFAAPPGNVKAMDVVYGHWRPFRGVPLTR